MRPFSAGAKLFISKRVHGHLQALLSIWLVAFVSLLVLALAGSHWASSVVTDYASRSVEENLEGIVRLFDREIDNLCITAAQLSGNAWVKRILVMQGDTIDKNRVSDFDIYEYQQQIKTIKQSNSLLYEFGIAFLSKNRVVASYGTSDIAFLAGNVLKTDKFAALDWLALRTALLPGQMIFIDNVPLNRFGAERQGTIFLFPLFDGYTSRVDAVMFAVAQNRDILSFLLPQLRTVKSQEALFTIKQQDSDEPFITYGKNITGAVRVAQSASVHTGWVFSISIPESILLAGAVRVRNILLEIAVCLGVFCILMSLFITRRIYNPFDRIARMFAASQDQGSRFISEYEAIQEGIAQLRKHRAELQAELEYRMPMARAASLSSLLTQESDDPVKTRKLLEILGLPDTALLYCVCLLLPMVGEENRIPDEHVLHQTLSDASEKCQTASGVVNGTLTVLFCADHAQAVHDHIILILETFPKCCVIIGEAAADAGSIARSFQTAQIASSRRIVSEGFRIVRYDASLPNKGGYYLPQDMEFKLMQMIRNGDAVQADALFRQLYRFNAEDQGASFASLRNLLTNIHLDVSKLLREYDSAIDIAWNENDPKSGIQGTSIEKMRESAGMRIKEAAALFKAKSQSSSLRFDDILKYTQGCLFDSRMSLTMVADAFGMSDSQISRLFSDTKGENFLNYVNRARVEAACELLKNEPYADVQNIALKVGYNSDVTFRRLFKKYIGLTPSEYREQYSKTIDK